MYDLVVARSRQPYSVIVTTEISEIKESPICIVLTVDFVRHGFFLLLRIDGQIVFVQFSFTSHIHMIY